GIFGVVQHSSQKQPPRSRHTQRTKPGSSWGGHLTIHIIQCPSGLTSLKRKRRAFDNTYHSMPFACASGLLQASSPASLAFSTSLIPPPAPDRLSATRAASPPRGAAAPSRLSPDPSLPACAGLGRSGRPRPL